MAKIETRIVHWSYSSMSLFLRNPLAFKKKYILKIYDDIMSPAGVVGTAGHRALESFLNGKTHDEAKEDGLAYINNISDKGIDYGKTGSREQILTKYNQALNFYFDEFKMPWKVGGVEESITTPIYMLDGTALSIPAKAFIDLVSENNLGEVELIDHKFVTSYTNADVADPIKFLQAMFNYHVYKAKYGVAPARMIFNECKTSKNRDGSPQIKPYVIEFTEANTGQFAAFYELYNACTSNVNLPDFKFLPNLSDLFDGQNSFDVFIAGIMGVSAPVSIEHRTEERKFVEKNFVPSAHEQVGNEEFTPEAKIAGKMREFGIQVKPEETHVGPSFTKYTLTPNQGVRMSKIAGLGSDIAIALSAPSVRIEAPILGTNKIGVEVPNAVRTTVELAERHYKPGTMEIPIGVDVYGETHHKDLTAMPHLLIAGATGSGKSVMLNVILKSLTKQMTPDALKLVLIDPKQVELAAFERKPHLLGKVITDNAKACQTLDEMVQEMNNRYTLLRKKRCRTIEEYIAKGESMPKIVIVVDEFADLMMSDIKPSIESMDIKRFNENLEWLVAESPRGKLTQKVTKAAIKMTIEQTAPPSAEESIIRIAQKARAVGMHLILATQRPSADVVTGLIKANVPTKIAFMATSSVNSKIILDQTGAETLTGKGDMLFLDPSANGLKRLQGLYA